MIYFVVIVGLLIVAVAKAESESATKEPELFFEAAQIVQEKSVFMEHSVHHKRHDIMTLGRSDQTIEHSVIFAINENLELVEAHVVDTSDPFSDNFGRHLTREQLSVMVANWDSNQHVIKYLNYHGITKTETSVYGDFVTASAPVGKWEEFFSTEFYNFSMKSRNDELIRSMHYSLPENIHSHVFAVYNTVQFPLLSMESAYSVDDPLAGSNYVHPDLLKKVYNFPTLNPSGSSSQAVYESLHRRFSELDLNDFEQYFKIPSQSIEIISNDKDNNGCDDENLCMEGNLDTQYIISTAPGTHTSYYYTDNSIASWVIEMSSHPNPPKVLSISYGSPENTVSSSDMLLFNKAALKLNSIGVTIIVGSGDNGASATDWGPYSMSYSPLFPAVSPYVTAVGATMGLESGLPEVACQSDLGGVISSGGGFSNLIAAPDWQKEAVSEYFRTIGAAGVKLQNGFNSDGRGYPDVALTGYNYVIMVNGELKHGICGTSATAPVFAGIISLVNEARIAKGKGTLGLVNPSLYKLMSEFANDIVEGNNFCTVYSCGAAGFVASVGWDPVTGIGSVNVANLIERLVKLGHRFDPQDPDISGSHDDSNDDSNDDVPTISPTITATPTESPSASPTNISTSPTHAPVDTPSISIPTSQPTHFGWIYVDEYSSKNTESAPIFVRGWNTGVCFQSRFRGFETIFIQYHCDSEFGYVGVYSDPDCFYLLFTKQMTLGLASVLISDGGVAIPKCTSVSSLPLVGVYSVKQIYDATYCKDSLVAPNSKLVYFEAFLESHCFSVPSKLPLFVEYKYPLMHYYLTSDCRFAYSQIVMQSKCDEGSKDDFVYSYSFLETNYDWSKYPEEPILGEAEPVKTRMLPLLLIFFAIFVIVGIAWILLRRRIVRNGYRALQNEERTTIEMPKFRQHSHSGSQQNGYQNA